MLVNTEQGIKDVSILQPNSNKYEVTADNYLVPKGEEGKYHAIIEVPQFNPVDGTRMSKPRVQKFGPKWFDSENGKKDLIKQGFKITILHDPKKWLAKNKEADQVSKSEKAKAALEAKENADKLKAEADKAERQKEINEGVKAALEAMGITAPAKVEKTILSDKPSTEVKQQEKPIVKTDEKTMKAANDADKK